MDEKKGNGCCGGDVDNTGATKTLSPAEVRAAVKDRYSAEATEGGCCKPFRKHYTDDELSEIPSGADLGLGSGNPVALADIRPGERVLDLGCGGGVDVFLAAKRVGPKGRVIGVDMTDEMIERSRENAKKGGFENVEFRLGLIESLPVEPRSIDLVISNCVVNLSPDKDSVFRSTFEALKPGGRFVISDIAFDSEPSSSLRTNLQAYCVCVAGADPLDGYLERIKRAGFVNVELVSKTEASPIEGEAALPLRVIIRARRPAA